VVDEAIYQLTGLIANPTMASGEVKLVPRIGCLICASPPTKEMRSGSVVWGGQQLVPSFSGVYLSKTSCERGEAERER